MRRQGIEIQENCIQWRFFMLYVISLNTLPIILALRNRDAGEPYTPSTPVI